MQELIKNLYEYYRELARFVTLLGDGHTGVIFPNEWYQDPEYFSMIPVILKTPKMENTMPNTNNSAA
mgnify:CR=1 FL=1